MEKHTIQCFRCATYYTSVFNMACLEACECNCMPFPSRPVYLFVYYYCFWHFDSFSTLVLTVNTQPTIACSRLAMEALEQCVVCLGLVVIYVYVYMYVCMCMLCVYVYVCMRACVYAHTYIHTQYVCDVVGALFWRFCCWLWASKCWLGISDSNDKISFN